MSRNSLVSLVVQGDCLRLGKWASGGGWRLNGVNMGSTGATRSPYRDRPLSAQRAIGEPKVCANDVVMGVMVFSELVRLSITTVPWSRSAFQKLARCLIPSTTHDGSCVGDGTGMGDVGVDDCAAALLDLGQVRRAPMRIAARFVLDSTMGTARC